MPGDKILFLAVDLSDVLSMIPIAIQSIEDGLLTPDEAIATLADQARIITQDGHRSPTLGELGELKRAW